MTEQRRHEAPEVGAMVGRMLSGLVARAAEGDTEAVEQLQAVERLAGLAMTAGLAAAQQQGGYSWAQLAEVTGSSRQNLSQRVGRAVAGGLFGARGKAGRCEHPACTGRRSCRQG